MEAIGSFGKIFLKKSKHEKIKPFGIDSKIKK